MNRKILNKYLIVRNLRCQIDLPKKTASGFYIHHQLESGRFFLATPTLRVSRDVAPSDDELFPRPLPPSLKCAAASPYLSLYSGHRRLSGHRGAQPEVLHLHEATGQARPHIKELLALRPPWAALDASWAQRLRQVHPSQGIPIPPP